MTIQEIHKINQTIPVAFRARYIRRDKWKRGEKVVCLDDVSLPHYRINNHIQHRDENTLATLPLSNKDLFADDYRPSCKYGH